MTVTFDTQAASRYIASRLRNYFRSQDTIVERINGERVTTRYASTANEVNAIVAEAYLLWHKYNVERGLERSTIACAKWAVGRFYRSIKSRKGQNGNVLRERFYSDAKRIILDLQPGNEKQAAILRLFAAKTRRDDIASMLGVSKQYVSAVLLKLYSAWLAEEPQAAVKAAHVSKPRAVAMPFDSGLHEYREPRAASREPVSTCMALAVREPLSSHVAACRAALAHVTRAATLAALARQAASRTALQAAVVAACEPCVDFAGSIFTGKIRVNELGQFSGLLPRAASREPEYVSKPRAASKRLKRRLKRNVSR